MSAIINKYKLLWQWSQKIIFLTKCLQQWRTGHCPVLLFFTVACTAKRLKTCCFCTLPLLLSFHGCLHGQTAQNVLFLEHCQLLLSFTVTCTAKRLKTCCFWTSSCAFVLYSLTFTNLTLFAIHTCNGVPRTQKLRFILYWEPRTSKVSPFKAWSILGYSHAYLSCCQGFLSSWVLPFQSIRLHFPRISPCSSLR